MKRLHTVCVVCDVVYSTVKFHLRPNDGFMEMAVGMGAGGRWEGERGWNFQKPFVEQILEEVK